MIPFGIFGFVLMTLAAARITRAITEDSISIPLREWVERKEEKKLGYVRLISFTTLLNCHWCTGWWVGLSIAGATFLWGNGDWLWWLWAGLGASYLLGAVEDQLGSQR